MDRNRNMYQIITRLVCIDIVDLFVGLKVIVGFLWNTRKEIIFYIVYISII